MSVKYLFLVLLAAVVVWRWRNASEAQRQDSPQPEATPQTINMVACAHCGLHAPRSDMVPGTRGVYCSSAHRTLAEPS